MVETQNKKESIAPKSIGKITPVKLSKQKNQANDKSDSSFEDVLLSSLQIFLRFHGIERSHASIRDMADVSEGPYGYRDAVSSLENMEFSANVGKLPARKITEGHCPLIVELKSGKTAVLTKVNYKKEYVFYDEEKSEKYTTIPYKEFKKNFSGGVLIAKSRRQQRDDKDIT